MFGENFKEENRLWSRVVAQECSPLQIFYVFLEFLRTYIFSLHWLDAFGAFY